MVVFFIKKETLYGLFLVVLFFWLLALGFAFLVSQILVRGFLGDFFTANDYEVIAMTLNALW